MCRAAAELRGALSVRRGQHRAAGRADGVPPGPGLHAHEPAEDAGDLRTDETFTIGGSEGAARRARATSRPSSAPASRVFEALKAYDQLKADGIAIRVIDLYSRAADRRDDADRGRHARPAGADHGRGSLRGGRHRRRGRAKRWRRPASRCTRLAVREIPRSGKPDELLDRYGISARHIVDAVREVAARAQVSARMLRDR